MGGCKYVNKSRDINVGGRQLGREKGRKGREERNAHLKHYLLIKGG
jgi:hypothetical protein